MPFKPYRIDDSVARVGSQRPYLVEGYYLMEVVSVDPSPQDHRSDDPFLTWNLRVVEGPAHVGRMFPYVSTMKPDAQFSLGRILTAISPDMPKKLQGKEVNTYSQHQQLASALERATKGKRVVALATDGRPVNGRPTTDLSQMFPESDWGSLKDTVVAPQAGGTTTSAPAKSGDVEEVRRSIEELFGNAASEM